VERLARRILLAVVLFVLAVAGTLVVRSRTLRTETPGPAPAAADRTLWEVVVEEESRHRGQWRLAADSAAVYEAEGRTALVGVRAWFRHAQRTWTVVGAEGDFFRATGDLEIRRGVVITSDDGLRLETSVLRWDDRQRRLWTDAPVRMVRAGAVVEGRALDARPGEERMTVEGPVRAVFTENRAP
jgi:LPS export ABC transporter protein LptC